MSRSRSRVRRGRTPLELAVLLVSLAAVASVVAGLIIASATGGEGPPDLVAVARPTGLERSGGALYELLVRNQGGQTAENVVVEVTVGSETREVEILSVSKGDEEVASVVFPRGTDGTAEARVLSYHETTRG